MMKMRMSLPRRVKSLSQPTRQKLLGKEDQWQVLADARDFAGTPMASLAKAESLAVVALQYRERQRAVFSFAAARNLDYPPVQPRAIEQPPGESVARLRWRGTSIVWRRKPSTGSLEDLSWSQRSAGNAYTVVSSAPDNESPVFLTVSKSSERSERI